ncbi:MAG TPA: hypothetical protein DDW52_17135 [Planctomycetaceae bacterium]|nr:hypothetical protein [Planctomycetaceae bacterium]
MNTKHQGQRPALTVLVGLMLLSHPLALTGCRTASSMGMPVSASMNYLLKDAEEVREATGKRAGVATELAKATLQPHEVEAGDVLVIEPNDFNSPVQIPSDHTVQQDGTIDLGSYGTMQVAGLSVAEIRDRVQQVVFHKETTKHQSRVGLASHSGPLAAPDPDSMSVAVRLISKERGLVYVMGEVNAPGSYPLTGSETALDAIIAAGGLSAKANEHKIILTRPQTAGKPRIVLPVGYQRIVQVGDVSTNYQLQPGDRIYVPSMTLWEDIKLSAGRNK